MKQPGALAAWLAKARSGHCPCGARVSRTGGVLCRKTACRQRYTELWNLSARGVSDRSVVTEKAWTGDGMVRIHYECRSATGRVLRSHFEDMPPSLAARVGRKRTCPICAGKT